MVSIESPFTLTIDWLAFTLRGVTAHDAMRVLGGEWTKAQTGFRGYPSCWISADALRGVGKLGTGAPRCPDEIHVDLSAGLVSTWPPEKLRAVIRWVHAADGHLTRIDCALDDRQGLVSVSQVREALSAGQCISRAEQIRIVSSAAIHQGTSRGETIYIGSPQSQTLLRIYDKRLELQQKGRETWSAYGVRWELEFKKQRAHACGRALSELEEADWREFVVTLLRSYLDFRVTSREASEEDRYRAPLLEWWATLTEGFQKGRLVIEQPDRTIQDVKRWVSQALAPCSRS